MVYAHVVSNMDAEQRKKFDEALSGPSEAEWAVLKRRINQRLDAMTGDDDATSSGGT